MVGDFNLPGIYWDSWTSDANNRNEELFIETLRDNYLYQHVTKNTRGRGSDAPHLLDLILTNEEGMVNQVNHLAPMGKSDNCDLVFRFECNTIRQNKGFTRYIYDRGNYQAMREDFQANWHEILQGITCTEKWKLFTALIHRIKDAYIPKKETGTSEGRNKKMYTDPEINKTSKHKNRAWQCYLETRSPDKYRDYTKTRNKPTDP